MKISRVPTWRSWSASTGKASLVRALLNKYANKGLRIIQIDKHDLNFLSDILTQIGKQPYRYIILCDDLSFEPDDPGYKILKSVLDGSVYASPKNVLIYVTSNRRHLLPEFHTDNLGAKMVHNEIHHGEAVEEKISLSDRFGLWLGFHPCDQNDYLAMIDGYCAAHGLDIDAETLRAEAIEWQATRGSRSGRVAWQFFTDLAGRHGVAIKG